MMTHRLVAALRAGWWQLAVLLVLAACGGSGDDEEPDYYPLAIGNRWVTDDGSELRVVGARLVDGQMAWVLQSREDGETSEALLLKSPQEMRWIASPPISGLTSYPLLRLPVRAGDRYPAYSYTTTLPDQDGDGHPDTTETQADWTVIGFESVTTPAGPFHGAAHLQLSFQVHIVYSADARRAVFAGGSADYWYAPGIGPVKFTSTFTTEGTSETNAAALAGYVVGDRRGGSLP